MRMMLPRKMEMLLPMLLVAVLSLCRVETSHALTLTLSVEYGSYPWMVGTRWTYASYNVHAALTNLPYDPPGQSCNNRASTSFTWTIDSQPGSAMTLNQVAPNPGDTENTASVTNGNNPPAAFPVGGGNYTVRVKCVATYTTPCGVASTVTQYINVPFFVIAPHAVVLRDSGYGNPRVTIWNGPPDSDKWGHGSDYDLRIMDNQGYNTAIPEAYRVASPYSNGLPKEVFDHINPDSYTYFPNGTMGEDVWGLDFNSGAGTPTSDFTDHNWGWVKDQNKAATNFLWCEFDQEWHCMELIPPTSPPRNLYVEPGQFGPNGAIMPRRYPTLADFKNNVSDTLVGTHHMLMHLYDDVRTGDGIGP